MVNRGLFVYGKIQEITCDTLIYINNRSCNIVDYRFSPDHATNPCELGWYKIGPKELAKW